MQVPTTVDIPVGENVHVCGCVGLIDDENLEDVEIFDISATINDPILTSSAGLFASVVLQEDLIDCELHLLTLGAHAQRGLR